MDERQKAELRRLSGGKIRFDCPMASRTTMGVGGNAEALVTVGGVKELQQILAYAAGERIPCLPIGRGSNLLVTDGGIDGLVVMVNDSGIEREGTGAGDASLIAGAGLGLGALLGYCRQSGLSGLEFLAGIPGTVGGAVAMNAGAFGSEIGERVVEIHWVTVAGGWEARKRDDLRFSYRNLHMEPGWVIVRARLRVAADSEAAVGARIADFLKKRRDRQPGKFPSAGSVFKNPPNDYAGRLIESVGLKGKRIGGAMISPKHANYIVNTGGARARDVLELLELVIKTVRAKTGVDLETEIRVVGK